MKRTLNNSTSGFTLLEVIIVLGISALSLSFGIIGVINLRKSLELKNGYSDLITNIKTIQNYSRNSIVNKDGIVPTYYVLNFAGGTYSLESCTSEVGILNCKTEKENLKALRFNNISVTSSCDRIGFQKLSANIVSIQAGNIVENGTCTINIKHNALDRIIVVNIDLQINKIDYE